MKICLQEKQGIQSTLESVRTEVECSHSNKLILLSLTLYFLLTALAFIIARVFFWSWLLHLLETRLSSDHCVNPETKTGLSWCLCLLAPFHAFLGILFFRAWKTRKRIIPRSILVDYAGMGSPRFMFYLSSAIAVCLSGLFLLPMAFGLPRLFLFDEDNVFQTLTCVSCLVSAMLMIKAALVVRQIGQHDHKRRYQHIYCAYVFMAIAVFFIAMEEISWGQRIFGWGTPSALSQINCQNETNVHNLWQLEHYWSAVQWAMSFSLISLLLLNCLFYWEDLPAFYRFVLPHPSLSVLAFLILLASLIPDKELFEVLGAVFAFFYSYRAIMYCRVALKCVSPACPRPFDVCPKLSERVWLASSRLSD